MKDRYAVISYFGFPVCITNWPACYTKGDLIEWYCGHYEIDPNSCSIDHSSPILMLDKCPTREYSQEFLEEKEAERKRLEDIDDKGLYLIEKNKPDWMD